MKKSLTSELQEQIDNLISRSTEAHRAGDFPQFRKMLLEAWELLPQVKGSHSESYHIAKYLANNYLLTNNLSSAIQWSEELQKCAPYRADDGEREFVIGRVEFEMGRFENAKDHFKIANKKSRGRCFINQDPKYKKFLSK